jgi:hypothetical protein
MAARAHETRAQIFVLNRREFHCLQISGGRCLKAASSTIGRTVELPAIRNSGSGQNPASGHRAVLPLAARWNPEYCGHNTQDSSAAANGRAGTKRAPKFSF